MIEKLERLKTRATNLRYKDDKELDDILRKAKMYLAKLFPVKFTYSSEIDQISFHPSIYVSGMGDKPYIDAWSSGQMELINLLDTRIEEYKFESTTSKQRQPEIQVVEKIVKVEDKTKINDLAKENKALRERKNLWNRINWTVLVTIGVSVIGGSFILGKYLGDNKFDREKIDLLANNQTLNYRVDSLIKLTDDLDKTIIDLVKQIPVQEIDDTNPLEVSISFLSPSSILDGKVFISAKEDFDYAILTFEGVSGVSKNYDGEFDNLQINIQKGDRFYFLDEEGAIWSVNVIHSDINVDLEIFKRS